MCRGFKHNYWRSQEIFPGYLLSWGNRSWFIIKKLKVKILWEYFWKYMFLNLLNCCCSCMTNSQFNTQILRFMLIAPLSWCPKRNLKTHLGWNGTMTCWTANFQCEQQKHRFPFLCMDCLATSQKLKIASFFLPFLLHTVMFRLKIVWPVWCKEVFQAAAEDRLLTPLYQLLRPTFGD